MQFLIKKNFSSLQLTDKVVKGMFGTENFNNNNPPPSTTTYPPLQKSRSQHIYICYDKFL